MVVEARHITIVPQSLRHYIIHVCYFLKYSTMIFLLRISIVTPQLRAVLYMLLSYIMCLYIEVIAWGTDLSLELYINDMLRIIITCFKLYLPIRMHQHIHSFSRIMYSLARTHTRKHSHTHTHTYSHTQAREPRTDTQINFFISETCLAGLTKKTDKQSPWLSFVIVNNSDSIIS